MLFISSGILLLSTVIPFASMAVEDLLMVSRCSSSISASWVVGGAFLMHIICVGLSENPSQTLSTVVRFSPLWRMKLH